MPAVRQAARGRRGARYVPACNPPECGLRRADSFTQRALSSGVFRMRTVSRALLPVALLGATACTPQLIDKGYQDFEIKMWGPDLTQAGASTDPFGPGTSKIKV